VKALITLSILSCLLRHYGWSWVRPEWAAWVWNISGSLVILPLVWVVSYKWKATILVALWWTFEELQVILCSVAYMADPWQVEKGQAICSAKTGFDLGALGIMFCAWCLYKLYPVKFTYIQNGKDQ
jgi:hypothetical protein